MSGRNAGDASSEAVVRDAARADDLDRYLAALLAPRRARQDLIALTAFLGEVARIPDLVNEPMMGEIRLQWWRDALEGRGAGARTGSPIADAILETIARHALPQDSFFTILEARSRELTQDPLPIEDDLKAHLDATDGAAFRLAARILGAGDGGSADALLAAAGQAYGRVRVLRALPASLTKGRSMVPAQDAVDWVVAAQPVLEGAHRWLKEARSLAPAAPAALLPAILPLALVEPYLTALEGLGPDITSERADISPLTRVWRLWWASVRGRV